MSRKLTDTELRNLKAWLEKNVPDSKLAEHAKWVKRVKEQGITDPVMIQHMAVQLRRETEGSAGNAETWDKLTRHQKAAVELDRAAKGLPPLYETPDTSLSESEYARLSPERQAAVDLEDAVFGAPSRHPAEDPWAERPRVERREPTAQEKAMMQIERATAKVWNDDEE